MEELMLDTILDKKLVKFDNKQQMSMFFIAYKSINALYKELLEGEDYKIPDEIIKRVVLESVPGFIMEYNGNLRKRCCNDSVMVEPLATVSATPELADKKDDTICVARKVDGNQCSKKKYNLTDFCKYHSTNLRNGRIDIQEPKQDVILDVQTKQEQEQEQELELQLEPEKEDKIGKQEDKIEEAVAEVQVKDGVNAEFIENKSNKPMPKISKRGRKSKIQFDPRQYDNEYLTLWEDIVEGEKVLVDNANNIYTFNLERPVYIGKKDITKKLDIRKFIQSLT